MKKKRQSGPNTVAPFGVARRIMKSRFRRYKKVSSYVLHV